MTTTYRYIATITMLSAGITLAAEEPASSEVLWYKQPAVVAPHALPFSYAANLPGKKPTNPMQGHRQDAWESQSLPVGNGRIGGTVFGGDKLDRVNLNEVSLWSGGPNKPKNGHNYVYGPEAGVDQFGSYQPFGNLYVSFNFRGNSTDYRRSLDLTKGSTFTTFTADGTHYTRECFVSRPDNVLVYTAKSDKKGGVTADIVLTPYHDVKYSVSGNTIIMKGTLANGQEFEGRALVKANGGTVTVKGQAGDVDVTYSHPNKSKDDTQPEFKTDNMPYVHVSGADSVVILVSLATDYKMDYSAGWKGNNPTDTNIAILKAAEGKSIKELRKAHREDYRSYYDRLSIDLGKSPANVAKLPTDERLAAYRKHGKPDPELEATIYQYGRYVLIAGSQPGNLPVTLQGIWNDKVHAPWACDYHNNINLQMNYWPACATNLDECVLPLVDFIKTLIKPGEVSAKAYFGARGWTAGISGNIFGFTAPLISQDMSWNFNPMAGPWLATHVWDYYDYTRDKKFLKETGYDIIKSSALFTMDYLWKRDDGSYTAAPSTSPEHGPIDQGATFVHAVVREILLDAIKAAEVLGTDKQLRKEWKNVLNNLVPYQTGRYGQLMEWSKDIDDPKDQHRHVNHLFGLHPGHTISPVTTPELAEASRVVLVHRGDGATGWSMGWKLNQWARLHDGNHAYTLFGNLLKNGTLDNLWDTHAPFQIDGNFGGTAGITEMLMQSHMGFIHILPALPDAWSEGEVKGICAKGGFDIDITWKEGRPTEIIVKSKNGERCNLRYGNSTLSFGTKSGKSYKVILAGDKLKKA